MKKYFSLILFVVLLFSFSSCEKQELNENTDNLELDVVLEHGVSADEAEQYALDFMNSTSQLKSAKKNKVKQIREMSTPFKNKKIFVVEFDTSGFVLMSDNRLNFPVLAYSETDTWDYNHFEDLVPGAREWLMQSIRLNLEIEADTLLQRLNNTRVMWDRDEARLKGAAIIDPDECTEEFIRVVDNTYDDGLLFTNWHQGYPFNACMDHCFPSGNRRSAGCGIIAMAQVMNLYQHPSSFIDWNHIQEEDYISIEGFYGSCGDEEIMTLIDEIVNNTNVTHIDCTNLVTPGNMEEALHNMGFSSAINSDYDINLLRWANESGHPVIIKGADNLFSQHYWICDGFREVYDEWLETCPSPTGDVTRYFDKNSSLYFHLNWGWGNSNQNIWYQSNEITRPEGTNYNFDGSRRVIHRIYPTF